MPIDPASRARTFGWWSLLVWLSAGLVLEGLHGFKVGWYLDVASETRRLLLTLAHAHGTLLSLVNLAFAATLRDSGAPARLLARAASCLRWGAVLLPLGFLLGGLQVMGGDPGYGIVLVPVGALLLVVGVASAARAASAPSSRD
jgi:hypothetical protein